MPKVASVSSTASRLTLIQFAYLFIVLLWGVVVRATGSGAGCGSHWPLCNGDLVPYSPTWQTLIEYGHRVTSGLSVLLVIGVYAWLRKNLTFGHRVRKVAFSVFVFLLIEAALGAMLVLLEHVGDNPSMYRAFSTAGHLVNTFVLSATAFFCWVWTLSEEHFDSLGPVYRMQRWIGIALALGLLLLSASGAITALGDTLFPAANHLDALEATFAAEAPYLVRLRVYHPLFAVFLTLALLVYWYWQTDGCILLPRISLAFFFAVLGQLLLGALNIHLHAPIWLQVAHLACAHGIWLSFLLLLSLQYKEN